MIRFQSGAKLKKLAKALNIPQSHVFNHDLPAGWSCPAASVCLSKADRDTGKIKDGRDTLFRCYAASLEAMSPDARKYRWEQFDDCRSILANGGPEALAQAFFDALPEKARVVRAHTSGDFFNVEHAQAWALFAAMRPDVGFYAYTKNVSAVNAIEWPDNFNITVSDGGRQDNVKHDFQKSFVVASAQSTNLPVDDDDTHAFLGLGDFALVVHGTQPKGGHKLPVLEG